MGVVMLELVAVLHLPSARLVTRKNSTNSVQCVQYNLGLRYVAEKKEDNKKFLEVVVGFALDHDSTTSVPSFDSFDTTRMRKIARVDFTKAGGTVEKGQLVFSVVVSVVASVGLGWSWRRALAAEAAGGGGERNRRRQSGPDTDRHSL